MAAAAATLGEQGQAAADARNLEATKFRFEEMQVDESKDGICWDCVEVDSKSEAACCIFWAALVY